MIYRKLLAEQGLLRESSNFNIKEYIESKGFEVQCGKGASEGLIKYAEKKLGTKFGPQLRDYLKTYGSLSFEYHEFTGLNDHIKDKDRNDLIYATLSVTELCKEAEGLIAVYAVGNGDYDMLDSNDNVYEYYHDGCTPIKKTSMDFHSYIKHVADTTVKD